MLVAIRDAHVKDIIIIIIMCTYRALPSVWSTPGALYETDRLRQGNNKQKTVK